MKHRPRLLAARPDAADLGRVGVAPLAISAVVAVAVLGAGWWWMQSTRPAAQPGVSAAPPSATGPLEAPAGPGTAVPADARRETSAPSTPAERLLRVHGALASWSDAHGGNYPQTLAALASGDVAGRRYLSDGDLLDGFGRPWIYVAPSNRSPYQLHSFGRDGVPGGEGEDRDLFLADVLPD